MCPQSQIWSIIISLKIDSFQLIDLSAVTVGYQFNQTIWTCKNRPIQYNPVAVGNAPKILVHLFYIREYWK